MSAFPKTFLKILSVLLVIGLHIFTAYSRHAQHKAAPVDTKSKDSIEQNQMKEKKSFNMVMAFLALNKVKPCKTDVLQKEIRKIMPPNTEVSDLEDKKDLVSCTVDGDYCTIMPIETPIPWEDLEGPCATSWEWRDAAKKMKNHKGQLWITVAGQKNDRVKKALILTRLMAAAIKCHDAAGVYWGDGTVVHEPGYFVKEAQDIDEENLPVHLWFEFRIQKNEDNSLNVITTGLESFGCMEVEILNSKNDISYIMPYAAATAEMQLKGENIRDGDTVGFDEITKIKVTYEKSIWDRPGKVMRLHL